MSREARAKQLMEEALERVVAELADEFGAWSWRHMIDCRSAADHMLWSLAKHGLIEQAKRNTIGNPNIWRVNGKLFGRTDGITHKKFDKLKAKWGQP